MNLRWGKCAFFTAAIMSANAIWAADPSIYFSFDRSMRANYGGVPDGQMEVAGISDERGVNGKVVRGSDKTPDTMLTNGITGKALIIGNSKNKTDKQTIEYTPFTPISGEVGSVSFWMNPNDWEAAKSKNFHIIFSAFGKTDRILIYKYIEHANLVFTIGNLNGIYTSIQSSMAKWEKNSWHHVCAVWTPKVLSLYLDGQLVAESPRKDKAGNFSRFLLGEYWSGNPGNTSIDELKIFKQSLTANDVRNEYLRLADKATSSTAPIVMQVGKSAVELDGIIKDGEYATAFTAMNNSMNAPVQYSSQQSSCFFSYDDEYLYAAMKTPANNGVKKSHDSRDANIWEDDAIELFVAELDSKKDFYQFIFNAGSGLYDAKNRKADWNGENIISKSSVINGIWNFECAIPWKSLDYTPNKLNSFRINMARDFVKTNDWTCIAPGDYFAVPSYAEIILNPEAPHLELTPFGELSAGTIDSNLKIKSVVQDTIDSKMGIKASVFPFNFEQKKQVNAGENFVADLKGKTPESGNFDILIKSDKFGIIYKNIVTYKSLLPVRLACIYTDIPEQQLVMELENSRLNAGKNQLKVILEDVKTKKIVFDETKIIPQDELKVAIKYSIKNVPNGEYILRYSFLTPANKVIASDYEGYAKYGEKRPWTDTQYGLDDIIPPPWTPIKTNNNSFACWGRTFQFGGNGFINSMTSQNLELLNNPIELLVNKKAVKFKSEIKEQGNSYTIYKLTPVDSPINLEILVKAEFDGLLYFTVNLLPNNQVTLDSLAINIPMNRKYVSGFDDCDNIINKIDLLNGGDKSFYINPVTTPYFWCGGDDVGIMGGSASRRGWYLKDKAKGMQIICRGDTVNINLTFVDTPLKIDAARSLEFYLQPTPVKPKTKDLRNLRIHDNMICWGDYVSLYFGHKRPGLYSMRHINYFRDQQENKGKRVFYYNATKGVSPVSPEWNYFGKLWHCNPPKLGEYMRDAQTPNRAARNFYLSTFGCLNCKDFYEYKLDSICGFLMEPDFKVKDLYFDLTWPRPCANETHGCIWTDEFGYKHRESDLKPLRDILKRIYIQMKQKNSDAMFRGHVISTRLPSDVFFDSIWVGELYDRHILNGPSYYNVLTPHLVRVAYASRNAEMEMAFIPQFDRALMLFAPDKYAKLNPKEPAMDKAICHFLGYMLVHDLGSTPTPKDWRMKEFFDAKDLIVGRGGDYTFYPYWKEETSPVKPSFFGKYCMVSTFAGKNSASIVLLNDSDAVQKFDLSIDCNQLGLPMNIDGDEIISKKKVSIKNGKLSLELAPRELKIVVFK